MHEPLDRQRRRDPHPRGPPQRRPAEGSGDRLHQHVSWGGRGPAGSPDVSVSVQARDGRDGHAGMEVHDPDAPAPDRGGVPGAGDAADPPHRPAPETRETELSPDVIVCHGLLSMCSKRHCRSDCFLETNCQNVCNV